MGAVLIAAAGYATGPLILKRKLADLDPTAMMGAWPDHRRGPAPGPGGDRRAEHRPDRRRLRLRRRLGIFCTDLALVLMAILIGEAGPRAPRSSPTSTR